MSIHNLCFERKYEKYQNFFSENFQFLMVKFLIYLNRRVFVMWRNPFTRNFLEWTLPCLNLDTNRGLSQKFITE